MISSHEQVRFGTFNMFEGIEVIKESQKPKFDDAWSYFGVLSSKEQV